MVDLTKKEKEIRDTIKYIDENIKINPYVSPTFAKKGGVFYNAQNVIKMCIDEITKKSDDKPFEVNNIIGIIGDRGSGKTSNLLSTQKYIKQEFNKNNDNKILVFDKIIDPSNFTSISNILHQFIAYMWSTVDEMSDQFRNQDIYDNKDFRKLCSQFEKMHEILNFETKTTFEENDPLGALEKAANYIEIKENLTNLVKDYLTFYNDYILKFSKEYNEDKETENYGYIAIFIDDVDLNSVHCFEMLEQLRRNLKIEGIIIFIGFNYNTLYLEVMKNYLNNFKLLLDDTIMIGSQNAIDLEKRINLMNMAKQYLIKLIPYANRAFMPDISNYLERIRNEVLNSKIFKIFEWDELVSINYLDKFLGSSFRQVNQKLQYINNYLLKELLSNGKDDDDEIDVKNLLNKFSINFFEKNKNLETFINDYYILKIDDLYFDYNNDNSDIVFQICFYIISRLPSRKDYFEYYKTINELTGFKFCYTTDNEVKKIDDKLKDIGIDKTKNISLISLVGPINIFNFVSLINELLIENPKTFSDYINIVYKYKVTYDYPNKELLENLFVLSKNKAKAKLLNDFYEKYILKKNVVINEEILNKMSFAKAIEYMTSKEAKTIAIFTRFRNCIHFNKLGFSEREKYISYLENANKVYTVNQRISGMKEILDNYGLIKND